MRSFFVLFTLFLLTQSSYELQVSSLTTLNGVNAPAPPPPPPPPPVWIGFRLSLLWSPGYCWFASSKCNLSKVVEVFTIHGLWPYDRNELSPNTSGLPAYNPALINQVPNLRNQLNLNWPNYELNKTNEGFWAYEWKKHGTISKSLMNQAQYFQRTLLLHAAQNIKTILANGHILPGTTDQNTADVMNVLGTNLGRMPILVCKDDPSSNKSYLTEIRLCYDQGANGLINCNHMLNKSCQQQLIYKEA